MNTHGSTCNEHPVYEWYEVINIVACLIKQHSKVFYSCDKSRGGKITEKYFPGGKNGNSDLLQKTQNFTVSGKR